MTANETGASVVKARIEALGAAVAAAEGRLPEAMVAPASDFVTRATGRLELSGDHTIVALAGATGSGKSSLFNQLAEMDLAGVGLKRPTTTWALSCAWGPDGAIELLEWMGIPPRHQISRQGLLDSGAGAAESPLTGLILLDLPDHDSTEVAHKIEMTRLLQHSDMIVWVLDPQKYADAALHENYIRPMSAYDTVTLCVLNQIDRLPEADRERTLADVRRLLDESGLESVPVIGVSARTGDGLAELRAEVSGRIKGKRAARTKLAVEVGEISNELAEVAGTSTVPGVTDADLDALTDGLVAGVGAREVSRSIAASVRRQGRRQTGWPLTRWIGRRTKVAKSLGHDTDTLAPELYAEAGTIQRAEVDHAARTFAERAAVGLAGPWWDAVRQSVAPDLTERLEAGVQETRLAEAKPLIWWPLANVLQWALVLAAVVGAGWWAADLAGITPEPPEVAGFALPVVLAVGGIALGIALAVVFGLLSGLAGRRRARRAEQQLREVIAGEAQASVRQPVEAELARYEEYRVALTSALR